MSDEVKNAFMIAVSLALTALLLGFISFLFIVRSQFAQAYNNNLAASQAVSTFMQYDKFEHSGTLYGADVIAAIRNYYDSGVEVAVKDTNGSIVYDITSQKASQNPSLVSMSYLSGLFPQGNQYTAILVYNQEPVSQVNSSYTPPGNANYAPSAIVFFQQ